jgi:DNA-directed RNA polymerase specialized sigma24 family protein
MATLRSRRRQVSDEAIVRALYEGHGRALLAYAERLTGDRAAGERLLEQTLVRGWRHPEVLTCPKETVRAWLFSVAHDLHHDRSRFRLPRPARPVGALALVIALARFGVVDLQPSGQLEQSGAHTVAAAEDTTGARNLVGCLGIG